MARIGSPVPDYRTLPDAEKEAFIFQRLQEWDAAMQRRDIARGITPYRAPVKTRTVPLPLELVFRPDVRGTYNSNKVTEDEDSIFCFFDFEPGTGSEEPVEDAWEMRDLFVRPEDPGWGPRLDGITLVYGRFGVGREDISVPSHKFPTPCHVLVSMQLLQEEFREWQSLIRAAMTTKMSTWPTLKEKFPAHKVDLLCEPMRLAVEWQDGRPVGIIRCSGILQALIATLQIDALMDAEYRFCACVGCPKSFKVKRKDQRYCDEDCKHRQVVRDGRERQRKAAQQPKSRHTERKSK
jgi:hypothetical protein